MFRPLSMRVLEFLRTRARAYQFTFGQPHAQLVLADLAKFCRAQRSCFVPGNHDATQVLIGRNEVWLRIQQHLSLTPDQLMKLYGGPEKTEGEDDA